MTETFVQLPPDGTGKQIDVYSVNTDNGTSYRQAMVIGDPSNNQLVAAISNTNLTGNESGIVTRNLNADAITSFSGQTILPSTPITTFDTTGFNSIAVQLSGNWIGSVIFQHSNDQVTWQNIQGRSFNNDVVPVDSAYESDIYYFPVIGKYFRVISGDDFEPADNLPNSGCQIVAYLRTSSTFVLPGIRVYSDQGNPLNIAGTDYQGNQCEIRTDSNGNLIQSDIPQVLQVRSPTTLNTTVFMVETTGYQTVSVQLAGVAAFTGTVTFQHSNDGGNWNTAVGYSVAGSALGGISTATAAGHYVFPAFGRYFRAYVSSGGTGTILATVALRNQAIPFLLTTNMPISLSQIVSTASLNSPAGNITSAIQVNGGNTTVPALPGSTLTVGNAAILANTTNYAPSAKNYVPYPLGVSGSDMLGYTRRFLLDTYGSQVVTGLDPNLFVKNPVAIQSTPSNNGVDGMAEVLQKIYQELKLQTIYLRMIPELLNTGKQLNDEEQFIRDDLTIFPYNS